MLLTPCITLRRLGAVKGLLRFQSGILVILEAASKLGLENFVKVGGGRGTVIEVAADSSGARVASVSLAAAHTFCCSITGAVSKGLRCRS